MSFCKNHNYLYFDNLRRVEKAETVLSLIHASYQAEIRNGNKDDIVRMLKNAYELFRFDAGTYTGDDSSQFASQYTIGHELGIWINSNLILCNLAKKVAENEITIKDYFDIFFLNYIQPIDNIISHPLLSTLNYAKEHNKSQISKDDLKDIYSWTSDKDSNNINGLFNMFIGSSYFTKINEKELQINYPIDHILNCCNTECIGKSINELNERFSDLQNYVNYLTTDHRSIELIKDKFLFNINDSKDIDYNSENIDDSYENEYTDLTGYNKIYYGIPGCGKSYKINAMLHHEPGFIDEAIKNNIITKADESDIFRTTYYLDYSNSDFIGQIYPSVNDKGDVTYIHVPGPFTEALERALLNKSRMIYLVIEEINRGNAAAIFGDTFQLLDRLKENKDGRVVGDSEYPVSNTFIEDYFEKRNKELEAKNEEKIEFKKGQIYIPHNLTILATMNTSDQNVFPLDTAFKRRWDREKVVTNWDEVGEIKNMYVPYTDITWKEFATTINDAILNVDSDSDIAISEDKQMGAYFVQKNMLTEKPNTEDKDALITFTSNVIDYLYNDVTKFDHSLLFEKSVSSYDKLYDRMNHYKALVVGDENSNVGKNAKVLSEFFSSKIIDKFVGTVKEQGNNDEQGTEN